MSDNKRLLTTTQRNNIVSTLADTGNYVWVVVQQQGNDTRKYYELPQVPDEADVCWPATIDNFGEFILIDSRLTHKDVDRFLIKTFSFWMSRCKSILKELKEDGVL